MTPPPRECLAFDAGASRTGIAWVRVDEHGWFHVALGHHLLNDDRYLLAIIADAGRRGAMFASETLIGWAYQACRVQGLVETARAEGRLLELARAAGGEPVKLAAKDWRGELCRSGTASNEQIRIVVEGLCKTMPTLPCRAREHVLDAAGLGIVAIARAHGRSVRLPPAVSVALFHQQAVEKATRAERKARGETTPKERRSLTRAQSGRRSAAGKRSWAARRSV